jgi:hypothetical protein
MDHRMTTEEFEREIEETMLRQGVDYGQAEVIVAMKHGELHGDLLSIHPLTDEQRRRLSMPLHEVMAALGELDDEFELPGKSTDSPIPGRGDRVAD